jgi:Tfp pilus assembly protein PilF
MFFNFKRPQPSSPAGLDFEALLEAQHKVAGQSTQTAKETYEAGAALLRQAEQTGFSDKSLLQEAGTLFSQALQQSPSYADPYLGMAQLFLLVEQKSKAHEYFSQAQRLQSQHPEVRRMAPLFMEVKAPQISEEAKAADKAQALKEWLLQPKTLESASDYDQAYDKLEKFLQAFVRSLSLQEQAPIHPSLDTDTLAELKQQSAELEIVEVHVLQTLKTLEDEFNLEPLEKQIWPLQVLLRKYRRALKDSQTYQEIQQQIAEALAQVRRVYDDLVFSPSPEEIQALEQQLEGLLDLCDHLADQLDELEQRQVGQADLTSEYQKLVLLVESLSEQLDGLIEEC